MLRVWDFVAFLFFLLPSSQALHIVNDITCSVPYIVPLQFQRHCDRSDEYYRKDISIRAHEGGPVLEFTVPPPNITTSYMRRTPNAWTHEPFCLESVEAQNGFCVYTNVNFAKGRGVSVIGTPDAITDVLEAKVFKDNVWDSVEVSAVGAKKYVRLSVPGEKRFEVTAVEPYKWGEHLHSYTPVVVIQDPMMTYMTEDDQTLLLRIAVERLPVKSREAFLSQYASPGMDPYIDRMDKNAFSAQVGRSVHFFSAALPETAAFNHDCRPNSVYHFNSQTLAHDAYVVRDINIGEELTLSYLSPYLNSTARRTRLNKQWGFNCTCQLCTASAHAQRVSDLRLKRIEGIIEYLNNNPIEKPRRPDPYKAELLVKLHEQERLWGPLAGAQMYAAMEYTTMGDHEKAKEWARKAKAGLALWSGKEHEYYLAMTNILGKGESGSGSVGQK